MSVSSERPGREAGYALDNFNGTWWSPAESDTQPTLTLDLLAIPPFDKPYTIDSSRIQFQAINTGVRPPALVAAGAPAPTIAPFFRQQGISIQGGGLGGTARRVAPDATLVAGQHQSTALFRIGLLSV